MPALDNSSQQTSKQPEQAVCGKLVDLSSTRRIPEYLQQTGAVNQWTLSASPCGVSHGNIMPPVCQSRLSETHPEQSNRNTKTRSKMMASGLVALCSVLFWCWGSNALCICQSQATHAGV
ncbi:TPA: hypothetical protein ACH3X2_007762 [Trebouxia sp. C0005]